MAICVLVSSRKTNVAPLKVGWSCYQSARCSACYSVAIRLFFSRAIQSRHCSPDRATANDERMLRGQPRLQLRQGGIRQRIDLRL